jgi:hypothetical protein
MEVYHRDGNHTNNHRDQRQPNRLTHFLVKCCLELGLTKWHGLDIMGRGSHGILRYGVVTYQGYLTPAFYTRFGILPSPHAEMLTTSTSTASQSNFSFMVILPLSRVICSPRPSALSNCRHNGQASPCLTYMDTQLYKVQTFNLRTLPAHPPCFGRANRGARFRANGSRSELLGTAPPVDYLNVFWNTTSRR